MFCSIVKFIVFVSAESTLFTGSRKVAINLTAAAKKRPKLNPVSKDGKGYILHKEYFAISVSSSFSLE